MNIPILGGGIPILGSKSRGSGRDRASLDVVLNKGVKFGARAAGFFVIEIFDPAGKLVSAFRSDNLITNEGLDRWLDSHFHGTTQIATWYCALFESDSTPAAAWTYDVPVYTECTAYDEATRPAFNEAASSSQSTTNSANKGVFTMNATKTLYGASLVSVSTKGDHAAGANNVLHCATRFAASQAVQDDYVVNLSYTVGLADDGS